MKINRFLFILYVLMLSSSISTAQKSPTDANIIGHVTCNGEHIPFATVSLKGTVIGVACDESGHFQLINVPVGSHTVVAQSLGYESKELEIEIDLGQTLEIKFELKEDALGLNEIVVTGDRNEKNRKDAVTVVSVISPKLLVSTYSQNLSQSLQYSSGLRIENNCQNCGFNQVRMNGMEGPYSQVLINSRPVFSSLAGVYGLELIPTNMIERVEIIKGGGSALYGSNAIAGTINVILKDPIANTYEFGSGLSFMGVDNTYGNNYAPEYHLNFNSSMVSHDAKTGMAIYASHKNQQPFDANGDGFSELSKINGITIGSRIYHRFGSKSKMNIDIFSINEYRRGGNNFEAPEHVADIAESAKHQINSAAITYDKFFKGNAKLSAFFSMQHINRDSYYGANNSLSDYGHTTNLNYSGGVQFHSQMKNADLIFGLENNAEYLNDSKSDYADIANAYFDNDSNLIIPQAEGSIIADQKINTLGSFAQYNYNWHSFSFAAGLRFDHYNISNELTENAKNNGAVFIPRFSIKYDVSELFQLRASWSQGYRAPQVFDEDLHIETSGSRRVIHVNAPDLTRELSQSFMFSADISKIFKKTKFSLLTEAFYTELKNPFFNEIGTPDSIGTVVYTRRNANTGATVMGVNLEFSVIPSSKWDIQFGYTIQKSLYDEAQQFGENRFFRTPDDYGYFNASIHPGDKFGIDLSGTYTGKMLVTYFGPDAPDLNTGELRQTCSFLDFGLKVHKSFKLNGASLQLFSGVKNILNAYQDDFDSGINRDPGYIYGPIMPRTIYFGIRIGNNLQ